jgi:hypothetical protein
MQLTRPQTRSTQTLSLQLPRGWWLLPSILGGTAIWVKLLTALL